MGGLVEMSDDDYELLTGLVDGAPLPVPVG